LFNIFALSMRTDEIRMVLVLTIVMLSAALGAMVRHVMSALPPSLERNRRSIQSPLGRILEVPNTIDRSAVLTAKVVQLGCQWIIDRSRRLTCRWMQRVRSP
jgi:hypothetical protein